MKAIPFMRWRWVAVGFSAAALLTAIVSLAINQLNWGLDFTGGTLVEVAYSDSADLSAIRSTLDREGYNGAIVVSFGTDRDVLVRLPDGYSDQQGAIMVDKLRAATDSDIELRRIEFVGPQVGDELRDDGGIAMLTAQVRPGSSNRSGARCHFHSGFFLAHRFGVRSHRAGCTTGGSGLFA